MYIRCNTLYCIVCTVYYIVCTMQYILLLMLFRFFVYYITSKFDIFQKQYFVYTKTVYNIPKYCIKIHVITLILSVICIYQKAIINQLYLECLKNYRKPTCPTFTPKGWGVVLHLGRHASGRTAPYLFHSINTLKLFSFISTK